MLARTYIQDCKDCMGTLLQAMLLRQAASANAAAGVVSAAPAAGTALTYAPASYQAAGGGATPGAN